MKEGGGGAGGGVQIDPPPFQEKLPSKSPALLGLMFLQDFPEVCMMPESLKILHYSMKLRRETYCQTQLM